MAREFDKRNPIDGELVEARETPLETSDDPPVVARLVVEIRSDGRRTIARGAMEDVKEGHQVAIEARGDSPLSLALALARTMFKTPALARTAVKALLTEQSATEPSRVKKPGLWSRWRKRR